MNISTASGKTSPCPWIFAARRFNWPAGRRSSNSLPGETRTYAEIARAIGHPNAFRAVGMANNRNPVAIVVPCHRVIATGGQLCGYGGGLDLKRRLLDLEHAHLHPCLPLAIGA